MKKFLIMVLLVLISAVMAEAKAHRHHSSNGILGDNTLLKLVVINNLVNTNNAHAEGEKIIADKNLFYIEDARNSIYFWETKNPIIEIKKGKEITKEREFFLSAEEIPADKLEKTAGEIFLQVVLCGIFIVICAAILCCIMILTFVFILDPINNYIDNRNYEKTLA